MPPGDPRSMRFPCSPGGAVAAGRRTLAWLLLSVGAAMVVIGLLVWTADRRLPAALCLAVAFALWTTWRMSGDLDLQWLEIAPEALTLQLRRKRLRLPLLAPSGRRLDGDEREHVARLASHGPVIAGTGGFDSHRLGEFNLYATDLDHAVLVDTGDGRVVVTPDDPVAFLEALAARGRAPAGRVASAEGRDARRRDAGDASHR